MRVVFVKNVEARKSSSKKFPGAYGAKVQYLVFVTDFGDITPLQSIPPTRICRLFSLIISAPYLMTA